LANISYFPTHEMAIPDHKLAEDGMKLLEHTIHRHQDGQSSDVTSILRGVECIARQAMNYYATHPDVTPDVPASIQGTYAQVPLYTSDNNIGQTFVSAVYM
jgi:hypothetical protein